MAQIRALFSLPTHAREDWFGPNSNTSKHLAYVEWFTPFNRSPHADHRMYKVSRVYQDGEPFASVIPVDNIQRSVMLFPEFGPSVPREWTSHNVLESCDTFYVNPFTDELAYRTIY